MFSKIQIFKPSLQKLIKMKLRFLLSSMVLLLILSGCKKTENSETLEEYIKRAGITDAVKDSRGFYYKIINEGQGNNPTATSRVTVFYKGTRTNGVIFDHTSNSPVSLGLNQVILGWQYGVPLIKPGGKIILYLPPSLGYGSQAAGSIPPNSVLIFEVQLVSVG
jgi:FKBP-type peptidyl-prolyl cis-trans isomerase FkpA